MIRPLTVGVALLATAGSAGADGLELDVAGARGIGRAGAILVSDDGASALLLGPAGLVRRGTNRLQVGMAIHDTDNQFDADAADSPEIRDQAAPTRAPSLALILGRGDRWVIGGAYLQTGDAERLMPGPVIGQPADQVSRLFPHRYGGLSLHYRRHTAIAGAAVRATDSLGLGLSLQASSVELAESRHIWAGFDFRNPVGDPTQDLLLATDGSDRFVPGATASLLYAPELPVELALAITVTDDARLGGDASLTRAHPGSFPDAEQAAPSARTTLASPLAMRAGARYLGERFYLEVTGDLQLFAGREPDPTWLIDGLTAIDLTGARGELTRVRSLVDRRTHGSARAAADIQLVDGFLWLSAGYAFHTAGSRTSKLVPAHIDTAGHTVAVGAEGQWEQMTLTIGFARTMAAATTVTDSLVDHINPFGAGSQPVGNGRYDTSHDAFGAALEISWE